MNILTFEEIEYLNMRDSYFKNGTLTFDEEFEDELYDKLNIDKSQVVKEEWLVDEILKFSREFMEFIAKVTDNMVMARIQALVTLYKLNRYDLSIRLCKVVDFRAEELRSGKINSQISIKPKKKEDKSKEDEDLRIAELQSQIERLTQLVEKTANNSTPETKIEQPEEDEDVKAEKKTTSTSKAGRPAKTKQ